MRLVALPAALLAFVGCGDNLQPGSEEDVGAVESPSDEPDHHGSEEPDAPAARALAVGFDVQQPSCDGAIVAVEALVSYEDDGAPASDFTCRYLFDDGTVLEGCVGEHEFAEAGFHDITLEVTDATGAVYSSTTSRNVLPAFTVDLALDVPACGLEFSYNAATSTPGSAIVFVEPADKFVAPSSNLLSGSFTALQPGTYSIQINAEDERAIPICAATVRYDFELKACPHNHPPDPHCPH